MESLMPLANDPQGPFFLLDLDAVVLRQRDKVLELTRIEANILECLMRYPGTVKTTDVLRAAGWGGDYHITDAAIRHKISSIRRKAEAVFGTFDAIKTRSGLGYAYIGRSKIIQGSAVRFDCVWTVRDTDDNGRTQYDCQCGAKVRSLNMPDKCMKVSQHNHATGKERRLKKIADQEAKRAERPAAETISEDFEDGN